MGDCEGGEGRLKIQDAASELYQLAALILGDERQAAEVVESAVSKINIDPCAEREASMNAARAHLVEAAVGRLSQKEPRAFDAPSTQAGPAGCIEEDDLAAAGVSAAELARLLGDPGRVVLRKWLNKLPAAQRAVFVLRAILGWDNAAAATCLTRATASTWQTAQVSDLFRQALCSVATSLSQSAKGMK